MTDLTIIPDLHADATRLETCLAESDGRKVAFLGDFIDAGKATVVADDLAVLRRVKTLIDNESAVSVLGNHELNAILFHRKDKLGAPLRKHAPKNVIQHASFLDQIGYGTPAAMYWTEWFLSLPLWIEKDGIRLVHACWDHSAIQVVKERRPDGRLHHEDLEEVAAKKTPFARAVELLTSGPEVQLPEGYQFHDMKGEPRRQVRIAWWLARGGRWRDVALSVNNVGELPDSLVDATEGVPTYDASERPVLVGHYKMQGRPRIEVSQAACLDYPERYCVYHWQGESNLQAANLRSCYPAGGDKALWSAADTR